MILVDTSVWIDFLRRDNYQLRELLENGEVATHPLIKGELHVGNIKGRTAFLAHLENLPMIGECPHEEVLFFIEARRLYGAGIGYADAHLLCSAITSETPVWTLDKRLAGVAGKLAVAWPEPA